MSAWLVQLSVEENAEREAHVVLSLARVYFGAFQKSRIVIHHRAKTDEERTVVLKTGGEPFTDGLLEGLADQAQSFTEEKGDYAKATMLLGVLLSKESISFTVAC
jgi:hypothetical protein